VRRNIVDQFQEIKHFTMDSILIDYTLQKSPKIRDEVDFLKEITSFFPRYAQQLNKLNESDAELIYLANSTNVIAITTDMVCEEIALGIYSNPFDLGWFSIIVNISDLCAVGATPKFVLLNQIFSHKYSREFIDEIQKGVRDACATYNVFVLGGDTNFSDSPALGGTMIGTFDNSEKPIQRIGAKPDEVLYASGLLGTGNLNAFLKLQSLDEKFNFKPSPNLQFSKIIAQYASSCMDISDGLMSAIDLICQLNQLGIFIDRNINEIINPFCLDFSRNYDLSPWVFLSGQLGDYELLFTIPLEKENLFLEQCEVNSFQPIKMGKTTIERSVRADGFESKIDTNFLRNLYNFSEGNIEVYIENLTKYFNTFKHD
jgi:thiamine-monophosphate kinase